MARGGPRPGAGRKAGTPNKATAERQREVEASGLTPLEYLLSVMREETNEQAARLDAAKAAAGYVHPKLASVDMNAMVNGKLTYTVVSGVPRSDD